MADDRENRNGNDFPPGIYELLINENADRRLGQMPPELVLRKDIGNTGRPPEKILSDRIRDEVLNAMEGRAPQEQLRLANEIMRIIRADDPDSQRVPGYTLTSDVLTGIGREEMGESVTVLPPSFSVASNAVLTASARDPQLSYELVREIGTADEIDMVVSFVRWSGLDLLLDALRSFVTRGGKLRVVTTTYMGVTEVRAVERLAKLPNTEIRICYDGSDSRLHAKAYMFHRRSGYSTAYIGSSNISKPALTTGFEWNTRIAAAESPDVFKKIAVTADEYWHDQMFEPYTPADKERLAAALAEAKTAQEVSNAGLQYRDIKPFAYQREVLERLRAERVLHNSWRNLVVAATGTGKTMMAAFDYLRWRQDHHERACRLLFVAHREEILRQSLETFRRVLGDPDFGALHVGSAKASDQSYLFMSIQSVNATDLCSVLPEDYYDYIVVDEFHHAAAPSYTKLLSHFEPKVLLGLTATPERRDKKSILDYFDGRIAAEIRLPSAIDQGLLCPFHFFGLPDTVNLNDVKWTRGGYDTQELENVYLMNTRVAQNRAEYILSTLVKYAGGLDGVKALGFCVSVKHAEFMAEYFNSKGVAAKAVTAGTPRDERRNAVRDLSKGRLTILFSVDLFNEGVDIPEVNTVLFLRPTESLTVFLQQLGRGLRLSPGKEHLLVLDYIGAANRRYDFRQKFEAVQRNVPHPGPKAGFPAVPRGCSIQLVGKAMDVVLKSISMGFDTFAGLRQRMEDYVDTAGEIPTFAQFLNYWKLSAADVLRRCMYGRLLEYATNVKPRYPDGMEDAVREGLFRMSTCSAPRWMSFLRDTIPVLKDADFSSFSEREKLMIAMFYLTVWTTKNINTIEDEIVQTRLRELSASADLCREVTEVLSYLAQRNTGMSWEYESEYPCPLEINGSYKRNQIMAAMGNLKPVGNQEGVMWVPDRKTDVLLVTLNKSPDHFADSVMYKDYAISADTIHWQSQNKTRPDSPTGQRYINQRQNGTHVLIFVRSSKNDQYGRAESYRFVGPADFVRSDGSQPMNIVWRLRYKMDPEFYQEASRVAVENA